MIKPYAINPTQLPSVPLEERNKLPEIPAVYFAIDQAGVVHYIGQSASLRSRWMRHHKLAQLLKLKAVRIFYLEVAPTELISLETSLLARFNPPYNGPLPKEARQQVQKRLKGQQTAVIPLAHLTTFFDALAAFPEEHRPEENTITLEHRPEQGMVLVARCREKRMCARVVDVMFKLAPAGFAWEVWGPDRLWDSLDRDAMERYRCFQPWGRDFISLTSGREEF